MDAIKTEDHQIAHFIFSLKCIIFQLDSTNEASGGGRAPPPQSRQVDLFPSRFRHTREHLISVLPDAKKSVRLTFRCQHEGIPQKQSWCGTAAKAGSRGGDPNRPE